MTDLFMKRDAVISDCGRYRYLLRRRWDAEKPIVLFIMLNPSTADAETDDATIRSCIRLTRAWGYGGFAVVNLFAWRSTDPKGLLAADDPVGPENDTMLGDVLPYVDFVVCAWGAAKIAETRALEVVETVRKSKQFAHCLGTTKSGAPKHPLYIKTDTTPEIYRMEREKESA